MNTDTFPEAHRELEDSVYRMVPDVSCLACGQCCVSPHMTLVEFSYTMEYLRDKPELFSETISRSVAEHPVFRGQKKCRFQQPDGLCCIHPGRPLACRLHGHPVLATMDQQYDVHCDKTKPAADITADDVYGLLDRANSLSARFFPHYQPPYWICGLNVETWLTILVSDMQQPIFRQLQEVLSLACSAEKLPGLFRQIVPLKEKVELIERFHATGTSPRSEKAALLERIRDGFPETGAYYYFEADEYLKQIKA